MYEDQVNGVFFSNISVRHRSVLETPLVFIVQSYFVTYSVTTSRTDGRELHRHRNEHSCFQALTEHHAGSTWSIKNSRLLREDGITSKIRTDIQGPESWSS